MKNRIEKEADTLQTKLEENYRCERKGIYNSGSTRTIGYERKVSSEQIEDLMTIYLYGNKRN